MAAKRSESELQDIVTRVVSEVAREVESSEVAFGVADFKNHLRDLANAGGESAWTISYSTSSSRIEGLKDVARVGAGGESAWTISYSTTSSAIEQFKK